MAKRFTDTDKWKKSLLKSMPAEYKLLWLYICDDCNHAGIWDVDIEVAALRIGEDLTTEKALYVFGNKIIVFDGGEKWFLPSFIEFQYGELSEKNRVHESVIKELSKYDLLNIKPLASPLQGAKDKDKDKEQDKDKEKDKDSENQKLLVPEMLTTFKKSNPNYPEDKNKDFPALLKIAYFIADKSGIEKDIVMKDKIIPLWSEICNYVQKDSFFSGYNIQQIEKYIQSIVLKIQNGNNTIGKPNQPITGYDLNKAHAKYFGVQ